MESPFAMPGFKPEAAFTLAAERFYEMLKTFGAAGAAGAPRDWSSLAGPLAGQFEQWLRSSQSAGPWFSAGTAPMGGFGAAVGLGSAASFGPLPLGAGAVPNPDAQRSFELMTRLAQLQGQLGGYWSQTAAGAAQRFVARVGALPAAGASVDSSLKLYELWVNCAEESYAATVRKDEFARLQAELANTSAALLVEQRRHAETLMRAFGLPTRNEVDALYAQLKELRAQLAALGAATSASAARPVARGKRRGKRKGRA